MDSNDRSSIRRFRGAPGSVLPLRQADLLSGAVLMLLIAVLALWPQSKPDSGAGPGPAAQAPAEGAPQETPPQAGLGSPAAGDSNLAAALGVSTPSAPSPETGASKPSRTSGVDPGSDESNVPARRSLSTNTAGADSTAEWQRYLEMTKTPLENSPGYMRPWDPEWRAVVRGRREAPEISMPLRGGASSLEALAKRILEAMEARDANALRDLHVTYDEFAKIVWPELPQSRPITHVTADDPWMFMTADMMTGIERAIGELGGRTLDVERVSYRERREYRNYDLYLDAVVHARDRATGTPVDSIAVINVAVERKGRFKVMHYEE